MEIEPYMIHGYNSGCDMMDNSVNNDLISNLIQSMNNEVLSSSYCMAHVGMLYLTMQLSSSFYARN